MTCHFFIFMFFEAREGFCQNQSQGSVCQKLNQLFCTNQTCFSFLVSEINTWHNVKHDRSLHKHFIEGSLEVKLPTIWTDEKQSREEAERRERLYTRKKSRRERVRRKKMQMHENVGKSRNTVFSQ